MHIAFTVDVQFNTVPWSPSRSSWHRVPWFAEQLPKNPISNMLHSVKSFAGWSNGWDINSQARKKLEVFDPSTVVSLHFFVVGIMAWLPTNTEMQILWSNNVMQTRLCGLHLVCAAQRNSCSSVNMLNLLDPAGGWFARLASIVLISFSNYATA